MISSSQPSPGPTTRPAESRIGVAALLIFAGVFLYLHLFLFRTPIFHGGDYETLLNNAQRMVTGHQLPYRDFFELTTPATDLVYAAMMHMFGLHAWIPNVLMLVIGIMFVWLTTNIS